MLVVRVGEVAKDGAISAVTRIVDALWRSLTTSLLRQNAVAAKCDAESRFHVLAPCK
jgi:hypothetical protein